jgi:hypothetical protein
MTIFELWRKDENKFNTRKYVTVAEDTTHARHLVAKYIVDQGEAEHFHGGRLDAGYPDEREMRQRDMPGRWHYGSVWDTCRANKSLEKAGVVYTYIC